MAPQWHQGTIAPRALSIFFVENLLENQVHLRFAGVLRALDSSVCGNHWKWLQLCSCKVWCDSLRKKKGIFSIYVLLKMLKSSFAALGVESPHDGAMDVPAILKKKKKKRPTWYMAEISTVMGYEVSFVYAGAKHTGWCYHMY